MIVFTFDCIRQTTLQPETPLIYSTITIIILAKKGGVIKADANLIPYIYEPLQNLITVIKQCSSITCYHSCWTEVVDLREMPNPWQHN